MNMFNKTNKFQGTVNEEICTTDEKCWLDKLVAVDKDHTREAGLHINEIERLLNDIDTYTRTKPRRGCPVDSVKVSLLYNKRLRDTNTLKLAGSGGRSRCGSADTAAYSPETIAVSDCLKANKGNTLICEIEVESFKKCIDKSLHAAVDRNMKGVRRSKKGSYLEAFERKYQF
ncbi:uncharacterized protein LOC132915370 [Bombus pascuorum]|uniref:uncharacterized protein LOC132915370 n=1 Tax=Bombus pascuorum TaxID=65598 RepID=UPI00298DFA5E|nr:uncharacterized protein LOC132915370 [Bombus pascuorum]